VPTSRGAEPQLTAYCHYFLRVLRAGFGTDKRLSTTIFQERGDVTLPVRVVAVHLGWQGGDDVRIEPIDAPELLEQLGELSETLSRTATSQSAGALSRRAARLYHTVQEKGKAVPSVFLMKADQRRNWTRSMALHEADEVAADILLWQGRRSRPHKCKPEKRRD
jgi:hypothetical protein